jgi:hypothetical protein
MSTFILPLSPQFRNDQAQSTQADNPADADAGDVEPANGGVELAKVIATATVGFKTVVRDLEIVESDLALETWTHLGWEFLRGFWIVGQLASNFLQSTIYVYPPRFCGGTVSTKEQSKRRAEFCS